MLHAGSKARLVYESVKRQRSESEPVLAYDQNGAGGGTVPSDNGVPKAKASEPVGRPRTDRLIPDDSDEEEKGNLPKSVQENIDDDKGQVEEVKVDDDQSPNGKDKSTEN